jgi:hypothetical protein
VNLRLLREDGRCGDGSRYGALRFVQVRIFLEFGVHVLIGLS